MKNFPTTDAEARDIIDREGKRDQFMEVYDPYDDGEQDPILGYFRERDDDPTVWFDVFNDLQIEFDQPTDEGLLVLLAQATREQDWAKVQRIAALGVAFGLGKGSLETA